jgi:hypothetical protein
MFIDTAITHPASITLTIAKGGKGCKNIKNKHKTRRRKHKYNRKTLRNSK